MSNYGQEVSCLKGEHGGFGHSVKGPCKNVAEMLRLEVDMRFLEVEFMNVLDVVFP